MMSPLCNFFNAVFALRKSSYGDRNLRSNRLFLLSDIGFSIAAAQWVCCDSGAQAEHAVLPEDDGV
jgi:hypothetical protein